MANTTAIPISDVVWNPEFDAEGRLMSSTDSPLNLRWEYLPLLILLALAPIGCDSLGSGGGGGNQTISTGPGQAVIPTQELENLGATEESLAPPPKAKTKRAR